MPVRITLRGRRTGVLILDPETGVGVLLSGSERLTGREAFEAYTSMVVWAGEVEAAWVTGEIGEAEKVGDGLVFAPEARREATIVAQPGSYLVLMGGDAPMPRVVGDPVVASSPLDFLMAAAPRDAVLVGEGWAAYKYRRIVLGSFPREGVFLAGRPAVPYPVPPKGHEVFDAVGRAVADALAQLGEGAVRLTVDSEKRRAKVAAASSRAARSAALVAASTVLSRTG